MSTELQSFTSDRIYCAVDLAEQKPGDIDILNLGCKSFYLKDEADRIIAELKAKVESLQRENQILKQYKLAAHSSYEIGGDK